MDHRKRPMPDWMMRYVSNIDTEECYRKFRELSKKYYQESDDPSGDGGKSVSRLDMVNINRVYKADSPKGKTDKEKFDIDEKYKRKSRELAHEQGYGPKAPLEIMQENNPTIDSKKMLSREDRIAETLHKDFAEKYPEKAAKSKDNAKKYLNREYQELHNEKRQERSSKKFKKSQESFEEQRQEAAGKGDRSFSKMTDKDDTEPDPPPSGGAQSPPKSKETEKSTENKANDYSQNKSDITRNAAAKRFFNSIGITQEQINHITDKDKKFANKDKDQENKNLDPEKGKQLDGQAAADRFFKSIGFEINKSDVTDNSPSADRTVSNGKVSLTYSGRTSGSEPNKDRELNKD